VLIHLQHFPGPHKRLRSKPRRFVRSIGVPANRALKAASSSESSSIKSGVSEVSARVRFHHRALARELVPRANRQTIIAAVNPIADERPQFDGNGSFQFDGEIRDAAARIEVERFGDAFVGHAVMQRVHLPQRLCSGASGSNSSVVMISERKIQFAQLAADQVRVLPDEAQPRALRQVAFEQRPSVHIPE